jgi:Fe-S cluster biogenesis protein NfuA/nitrite reductase/ring-hydroxylating ferredoxin subunit
VQDTEVRERVARVESLLDRIPEDPVYTETLQAIVELYGEALRRVGERVSFDQLVEDELISHLLLVHGLHPVDVETRTRGALEEVRPYLHSHGGEVELLAVDGGVARVQLQGSCDGCPSSATTMRLAIEEAVLKAAPELSAVEAEGVTAPQPTLLQLGAVQRPSPPDGAWSTVGGLPGLAGGEVLVRDVAGVEVLFARVDATAYAYRSSCPGCTESLENADLDGGELVCAGCGHRYDLRRAGRCLDSPALSLEPVPLLESDAGLLKVAVA